MILIIIITYNSEKWIRQCLNSIQSELLDYSILCIDNNSSDDTVSILKREFESVILISLDNNLGFGKANNIGLKYAIDKSFDFVFLLNQDTWLAKGCLESLRHQYIINDLKGILSPLHLEPSGNNFDYVFESCIRDSLSREILSPFFLKDIQKKPIYKVGFVNGAAWFFSLDVLKKIGGFNPAFFHYGEDNNLGQRLNYHNMSFYIDPTARIFHDCPQVAKRTYQDIRSQAIRDYSDFLIVLSNPKYSFIYNLREVCVILFSDFIKSLLPFRAKAFKRILFISFYIFRNFL
ncbi:MAG: glycosyltransferase, partial [Algoriphagus sp.]